MSAPTGQYEYVLLQNGENSTVSISLVSGVDVMNIANRPLIWGADDETPWNCLCESKLVLMTAQNLVSAGGLNCTACLIPSGSTGCCTNCFEVSIPSFQYTVSGVTWNFPDDSTYPTTVLMKGGFIAGCEWQLTRYGSIYSQQGILAPGSGPNVTSGWTFQYNVEDEYTIPFYQADDDSFDCSGGTLTLGPSVGVYVFPSGIKATFTGISCEGLS